MYRDVGRAENPGVPVLFGGHNLPTVQCNLDLVTLNLVTICDLVTILQRPFFILVHKSIRFSDIMQLTVFAETKSVTI